jgi:endogenous inhibitor of DNA gyrase (YacG/DUF329 family)
MIATMDRTKVACPVCGERDIPRFSTWLWNENGHRIHPWCSPIWSRISLAGRAALKYRVWELTRSA